MKNILKDLLAGLTCWLSKLQKTSDISKDGSTELTGNGIQRTDGKGAIDWTIVVIFVIFGLVMYFIPSPFQFQKPIASSTTHIEYINGVPDTISIYIPAITGTDSTKKTMDLKMPEMVEVITDQETENAYIYIRSSAYPIVEGDSLTVSLVQEFNIQPKTFEVTKTDTVVKYVANMVEQEIPFFEKPGFVIPATALTTATLIYLILKAAK